MKHPYPFDPGYGYSPSELLTVGAPAEPADFEEFWMKRYAAALETNPGTAVKSTDRAKKGWRTQDLSYQSTGGARINGWCLTPASGRVERVIVILHGYGGRQEPDYHWKLENTALVFPCARGLGKSPHPPVSANPMWHVLHNIQDRDHYILGGCMEDVWLAVSAALELFPQAAGRVGLIGSSFGGGVGAMAVAWDMRIARAHFSVPSFGNQPLRLTLPTTGSGAAVRAMHQRKPEMVERTLMYFDAAVAARRIQVPTHFACALFDPMVAPPGQFAVYNAVPGEKELFSLRAGHFEYPEQAQEECELLQEVHHFFTKL